MRSDSSLRMRYRPSYDFSFLHSSSRVILPFSSYFQWSLTVFGLLLHGMNTFLFVSLSRASISLLHQVSLPSFSSFSHISRKVCFFRNSFSANILSC